MSMQVSSDMQATSYPTQPGVPDQTVYVHQPAPASYATTMQNPNSSNGMSQNFNGAAGRATGWLQLSLGIGSFAVAIVQLVLHTGVGYTAIGIWASVLFYIPTGILGICSMQKNSCVIISYLTMCIIAAIVAFAQMIAGAFGAGVLSNYFYCYPYGFDCFNYEYLPRLREARIASDSLLAILGMFEMVVAIVASAYCCGGILCGTVYTQLNTPTVVTTGQYTQPAGIAQPPPSYNAQQMFSPAGQPVAPAPYNQAPGSSYNQAPAAPDNQAPPALYNQAHAAPYNQAPAVPDNQAPAAPDNQAPAAPDNQAPGAPDNQAPTARDNQAPGAPFNQAPGAPYNQQAAAVPTKPGGVVA